MKATHIIKTASFDGDGRLQKWIKSLKQYDIVSEVHIVEDDNKKGVETKLDSQILKNRFISRKFFSKNKGQMFKVPEYGLKFLRELLRNKSEVIVFHDMQQYMNIFIAIVFNGFFKKRFLIWDLHELPHTFLNRFLISRLYLEYILSKVDLLVYTNEERRSYMLDNYKYKEKKYVILNNFPDSEFILLEKQNLPQEVSNWLGKRKNKDYVLWMGAALEGRNFQTLLSVFEKYKDRLNLVIMGNIAQSFEKRTDLLKEEGVLFNKYVSQDDVIKYVDNAMFSVVLYQSSKPNNFYCEPNRLYQLISRNIPVIVGNNPTMKNIVNKHDSGIVLKDDGSDVAILDLAVSKMLEEGVLESYGNAMNGINKNEEFSWDRQFYSLFKIIDLRN